MALPLMVRTFNRVDTRCSGYGLPLPLEREEEMKVWLDIDLRRNTAFADSAHEVDISSLQEVEISRSRDSFFVGYGSNISFTSCEQCVIRALSHMREADSVIQGVLSISVYNHARSPLNSSREELVIFMTLTLLTVLPESPALYIPVDLPLQVPRPADDMLIFDGRLWPDDDDNDDDDDDVDVDDDDDVDDDEHMGFRATPASRAAICKSLRTQNFDQRMGEFNSTCAVCLDGFIVGMELKGMPCMHLFHEDCIVTWLNQSNSCPICRFKLQDDDDDDS